MIHQATSGTNLTDAKAEARVFLAKDAGLLVGLYHCLSSGTIRRQAESFVSTVEALGLEDNWLLAVQVDGKTSVEEVLEFLELVETRTRRKPVLFAGSEFLGKLKRGDDRKVAEYRLWLQQHETVAQVPVAWGKYFLWQYTDEGEVDGVEGSVGCSDSLIQEAEALAKSWAGFKGKEDGSDDVQIDEPSAEPVEPTMTAEGELDNAPVEEQPAPPEITESGEIDKPADPDAEGANEEESEAPPTAATRD
jgi:GH25 family lysozyme M1 (1,4-beta-N-acetylmuramidase)